MRFKVFINLGSAYYKARGWELGEGGGGVEDLSLADC